MRGVHPSLSRLPRFNSFFASAFPSLTRTRYTHSLSFALSLFLFNVLIEKVPVEIRSDRIVGEPFLGFHVILCLVLENDVTIPSPLDSKRSTTTRRRSR